MRTDILYVVKPEEGSSYEDLRLSLRSVAKNCLNVGKVYLIGAEPSWLNKQSVVCMPYIDHFERKHKNILDSIMFAVKHLDVGSGVPHGMFMYSSDDHFYVQEKTNMEWGFSPVWFCGNIHNSKDIEAAEKSGKGANGWLHSMVGTRAVLTMHNHNTLMFSQHANTWFSRELMEEGGFGKLVASAQASEWGCEPSCLMGNYMLTRHPEWIGEVKYRKDVKISNDMVDAKELAEVFYSGRECISGSPKAANGMMIKRLRQMFVEKCKYEK